MTPHGSSPQIISATTSPRLTHIFAHATLLSFLLTYRYLSITLLKIAIFTLCSQLVLNFHSQALNSTCLMDLISMPSHFSHTLVAFNVLSLSLTMSLYLERLSFGCSSSLFSHPQTNFSFSLCLMNLCPNLYCSFLKTFLFHLYHCLFLECNFSNKFQSSDQFGCILISILLNYLNRCCFDLFDCWKLMMNFDNFCKYRIHFFYVILRFQPAY